MRGDVADRLLTYDKAHCFQKEQRILNLEQDLRELGMSEEEASAIRVSDMTFRHVESTDKAACAEVKAFIERHEWLGTVPNRPTHRFVAAYDGRFAGVLIMAVPNQFSKLLGDDTAKIEKLVARGASISWAPKNLGSWLIMRSVNWMVEHTEFRLFCAYSDPEARELGTVYQACNWFYLGQSGGKELVYRYRDDVKNKGWFSRREFRKRSAFIRYAKELGRVEELRPYLPQSAWKPDWDRMPPDLRQALEAKVEEHKAACITRVSKPKHKYALIRGANKRETRELIDRFRARNSEIWASRFEYPRDRGS